MTIQLTKNFTSDELACPCCGKIDMKKPFLDKLQQMRNIYGKALTITSGYRCAKHNAAVKGAKASHHLQGNAVDIACSDMVERYKIVRCAQAVGMGGIECSAVHVHVDNRDDKQLFMFVHEGRIF